MSEGDAQRLSEDPRVDYVEEDGVIEAVESVQTAPLSIGLDRIDQRSRTLDATYRYWGDGTGVHVYVLDTGIRVTHEEFGGRASGDFSAVDDGFPLDVDCGGHGTHVAAIAGGFRSGVAKNVRLHSVKVLGCTGSGTWSGYIAALDWLVVNHSKPAVINASLNGPSNSAADMAVARAVAAGIVHVSSAGNNNADACFFSPRTTALGGLVVGNATSLDVPSFDSNFGSCVDIFAPGVAISSASNAGDAMYLFKSGTSQAAPHVAGGAALYLQDRPGAFPSEVVRAVLTTATRDVLSSLKPNSPNRLLFTPPLADTEPPSVAVLVPGDGTRLSGSALIAATANDNVEVAHVAFIVNGTEIARDESAPFEVAWDTRTVPNAEYTTTARAVDLIGNTAESSGIRIVVQNDTPEHGGEDLDDSDVGDVGLPGSFTREGDTYTLRGSGEDVWGTEDAFQFARTIAEGDFEVVVLVASVQNVDPWTKAGLMIRETLSAGSRHAFALATPAPVNGVAFQRRITEDGESVHTSGPAQSPAVWLRLVRQGDVVTAYHRPLESGVWTMLGAETFTGLSDRVFVGMAVTSHLDGTAAEARFERFGIAPAPAAPRLPTGWQIADVGTPGVPGRLRFDGTTYALDGSGADIWDTVDAFSFGYLLAPGDGSMTVRVADISSPHDWSKAGLMIRESLAPDAAHHFLLASGANGLAYQRRVVAGGASLHTGLIGTAPAWFRIERSAGIVRLYYSLEAETPTDWQMIVDTPFREGDAFIGLAVTSHSDDILATGLFNSVTHTFEPEPLWIATDIGGVSIPGSDSFDGSTHTLTASGTDIWDTSDAFRYKFRHLQGDGTIVARLAALAAVAPWTKAGLMIRENSGPSSAHAFVFLSRDHGVAFQRRTSFGGPTDHTAGAETGAPVWMRLTRTGATVTASMSLDGSTWTWLGTEVLPIGANSVLVGLALTSHDDTALATATFDRLEVTPVP